MSHEQFLDQYLIEAIQEMNLYLGENVIPLVEDENGELKKAPVYKENYYLRDHLQIPFVSKVLSKPRTREKLIEFTGSYMDEHSTQLSTSGPVHIFTFADKEVKVLYEMFGIDGDKLIELYLAMIDEAFFGKISQFISGWVRKAPHKILITAILIDALQNDYADIVTCCEYLWAFCEYAIVYRIFWQTGVKEDVMNYTIEHLGSKFIVKKVNNLQELLKYDTHSAVTFESNKLKTGADNAYTDLMQRIRNQIKNKFKNIASAYYANDSENATQHSKASKYDDGSNVDQEGHNSNVASTVENTYNRFLTNGVNTSIAKISAESKHVDKDTLIGYINQISGTKGNRLYKFIENVITAYFIKNPTQTSVGSSDFLNFGLSLYRSIGTSKDELYQEIRLILNHWMFEIINIRGSYQNEGTIINYTRSIFDYMILMINHYN